MIDPEVKVVEGLSGQIYDVKMVPDPILGGETEQVQIAVGEDKIVYTQDGG